LLQRAVVIQAWELVGPRGEHDVEGELGSGRRGGG
jgi:hypothetical protein